MNRCKCCGQRPDAYAYGWEVGTRVVLMAWHTQLRRLGEQVTTVRTYDRTAATYYESLRREAEDLLAERHISRGMPD